MSGWIYLVRNRDLYKIGITKNFDKRMRQLKPDSVITKLYTREFMKIEKELHNRYKKFRIPQTEYFRLENFHLKEIKQRFLKLNYPISMILWIFLRSLLFILIILFLVLLLFSLNINDINIILLMSFLSMERISLGISFFSLFVQSGKYLSFSRELKYRLLRLFIYIFFAICFRVASIFF